MTATGRDCQAGIWYVAKMVYKSLVPSGEPEISINTYSKLLLSSTFYRAKIITTSLQMIDYVSVYRNMNMRLELVLDSR